MSNKKKGIILLAIGFVLLLLGVLAWVTNAYWVRVAFRIYSRLLYLPIVIYLLQKCFKDQITTSMNKVLILCGIAIFFDMVIVDTVRFLLCEGASTVLFLPACLPIGFMIVMFYSAKDMGKAREKKRAFSIGIPLLLLSLFFEILSFL